MQVAVLIREPLSSAFPQVREQDIWAMVGGAMGFISNFGPPKLSSPEVGHQLAQIHEDVLLQFEGGWLGAMSGRNAEMASLRIQQQIQEHRARVLEVTANRDASSRSSFGMSPRPPQANPSHFKPTEPQPMQSRPIPISTLSQSSFGAMGTQPLAALRSKMQSMEMLQSVAQKTEEEIRSIGYTEEQVSTILQYKRQQAMMPPLKSPLALVDNNGSGMTSGGPAQASTSANVPSVGYPPVEAQRMVHAFIMRTRGHNGKGEAKAAAIPVEPGLADPNVIESCQISHPSRCLQSSRKLTSNICFGDCP